MSAQKYAFLAQQLSERLSPEEKQRRQENARKSNVSHAFTEEEATMFHGDTDAAAAESEHQPSRFGGAIFAHA